MASRHLEGSPHTGLRNAQAIDRIDGRAAEADKLNPCAAMPLELVLIPRGAIVHITTNMHITGYVFSNLSRLTAIVTGQK